MGEFDQDLASGKEGEQICKALLRKHPATQDVLDVSEDSEWQKQGVDFLWATKQQTLKVEAKSERRFTGNLFLELESNCTRQTPGWFKTSCADLIAFGFLDTRDWYFFALGELRTFVAALPEPLGRHRSKTWGNDGRLLYETEGELLALTTPGLDRITRARLLGSLRENETLEPSTGAVAHSLHPEWGIGRLVMLVGHNLAPVTQLTLHIEFENHPETKVLSALVVVKRGLLTWADGRQLTEADIEAIPRMPSSS